MVVDENANNPVLSAEKLHTAAVGSSPVILAIPVPLSTILSTFRKTIETAERSKLYVFPPNMNVQSGATGDGDNGSNSKSLYVACKLPVNEA